METPAVPLASAWAQLSSQGNTAGVKAPTDGPGKTGNAGTDTRAYFVGPLSINENLTDSP